MNRFGRAACPCSRFASAIVPAASSARVGETSSETKPSAPKVASWTGRNRSAATCRSSIASSKNSCSGESPALWRAVIAAS
jgi:hypothetical protein